MLFITSLNELGVHHGYGVPVGFTVEFTMGRRFALGKGFTMNGYGVTMGLGFTWHKPISNASAKGVKKVFDKVIEHFNTLPLNHWTHLSPARVPVVVWPADREEPLEGDREDEEHGEAEDDVGARVEEVGEGVVVEVERQVERPVHKEREEKTKL